MKNYSVHVDINEILSWIGVKKEKIENLNAENQEALSSKYSDTSSSKKQTVAILSEKSSAPASGQGDASLPEQDDGNPDPALMKQIRAASSRIESDSAARYTYTVFDIERPESGRAAESLKDSDIRPIDGERQTDSGGEKKRIDRRGSSDRSGCPDSTKNADSTEVMLKGSSLILTGNDISDLLKDCSRCILLAVTIGGAVDRTLRKAQISDMADAVILDFCASSAVEDLCSQINDDLEKMFESKGFFLTDRFSPGYGDLPIELQREICRVLQTDKRLGLSANSSNMLIPSKSITAVIGISNNPQPKKITGCANCKMKDTCMLRKAGRTCE